MFISLDKGLGTQGIEGDATPRWNLLREELSLPSAVLYADRIAHNLQWMQRFVVQYGARLAPHGKTTMAPKLFRQQLAGGAWGITLATAHQTAVAYRHGVRRVLMANQLVGRQNMQAIADLLADPAFDFYCLIDSADNVDALGAFFSARGRTVQVLIELGPEGGRTGIRDRRQLNAVIEALSRWHCLLPAGIELYEGVLRQEASVRAFLQRAVSCVTQLAERGIFARRSASEPVILSGAGSAWYDVVAEEFGKADIGQALEIVLRPGCYLTHDAGIYREAQRAIQARNPIAADMAGMAGALLPALQLWAYVQSIPEPTLAIVGFGKRDTACDAGMPLPALWYRPDSGAAAGAAIEANIDETVHATVDATGNTVRRAPQPPPAHWEITALMDQHAYMKIEAGDDIRVGDMMAFDISHPCLTFDKWRQLPLLDAQYDTVDVIATFF